MSFAALVGRGEGGKGGGGPSGGRERGVLRQTVFPCASALLFLSSLFALAVAVSRGIGSPTMMTGTSHGFTGERRTGTGTDLVKEESQLPP